MMVSRSLFVADTHALWWYFRSPERLSVAASAVFQLPETANATVVIPAIVAAEFYYLSAKLGSPMEPSALLETLDSVSGIELSELGRAQLERCDSPVHPAGVAAIQVDLPGKDYLLFSGVKIVLLQNNVDSLR